jgi:CDP-4-dehydro-6-deoxyglucose reductase
MPTVTVRPSGLHFTSAVGEVILNAAIRAGVRLPYGCRDGVCGSCKCRLVKGQVERRQGHAHVLSAEEQALSYILACQSIAESDVVLESDRLAVEGSFSIRRILARVASIRKPADDIAIIHLELQPNTQFEYRAGQFVVVLRDSDRRSYSIANAPHTILQGRRLEFHLRHFPGGKFTDYVFDGMKVKDVLRLEGPHGAFFLREESKKPIVFLASGTGLAPIKAIVEHMISRDIRRDAVLYWGARHRNHLYDDAWARAAAEKLPTLRYIPVLSEPRDDDHWSGRVGLVHRAVMRDLPDLTQYQVYACGVPIVVASARRDFVSLCGLLEDEFYADAFVSQADLRA